MYIDHITLAPDLAAFIAHLLAEKDNYSFIIRNGDDPIYAGTDPDGVELKVPKCPIATKDGASMSRIRLAVSDTEAEDFLTECVNEGLLIVLGSGPMDVDEFHNPGPNDPFTKMKNDPIAWDLYKSVYDIEEKMIPNPDYEEGGEEPEFLPWKPPENFGFIANGV